MHVLRQAMPPSRMGDMFKRMRPCSPAGRSTNKRPPRSQVAQKCQAQRLSSASGNAGQIGLVKGSQKPGGHHSKKEALKKSVVSQLATGSQKPGREPSKKQSFRKHVVRPWATKGKRAQDAPLPPKGVTEPRPQARLSAREVLGSAFESDSAHIARHGGRGQYPKNCIRCICIHEPVAVQKAGAIPGEVCQTWVEPRPAYKGGTWAVGCRVCAWHQGQIAASRQPKQARTQSAGGKKYSSTDPRSSKWANFNVAPVKICRPQFLQNVESHARQESHRRSVVAMGLQATQMGNEVVCHLPAAGGQGEVVDKQVLRGRVPQAKDWRDALVDASENLSWRVQERLEMKKSTPEEREEMKTKTGGNEAPTGAHYCRGGAGTEKKDSACQPGCVLVAR